MEEVLEFGCCDQVTETGDPELLAVLHGEPRRMGRKPPGAIFQAPRKHAGRRVHEATHRRRGKAPSKARLRYG
jgi:hypothetical protein